MDGSQPEAAGDNPSLYQLGTEVHFIKRCMWTLSSTSDFETLIMKPNYYFFY